MDRLGIRQVKDPGDVGGGQLLDDVQLDRGAVLRAERAERLVEPTAGIGRDDL